MSVAVRKGDAEPAAHVLVVDDDAELCELMGLRLAAHGYRTSSVHTAHEALGTVKSERPDAVILDLRLGAHDGLDVLVDLLSDLPDLKVLVLTAHGSIETAVDAMRRGAHSFLTKPFRDRELLDTLAEMVDSKKRPSAHLMEASQSHVIAPLLVGTSPAMSRLRKLIERLAPTDATVLISGESGTGKELVARSLHDLSPRQPGPFVPLNCGSLPPELLTSELFGHTRGAFTGATHDREGVFGAARGGTLFLDEIGEAPLEVQVRLLRVLQEQRYTPVGSTREKLADVRVVAATNRDLRAEVSAKRFREDLFYRLHVVPISLPPLRQRGEDIPLLAQLFLERAATRHKRSVPRLSQDALALLSAHRLPGNVRELSHVMEAAVLLGGKSEIDAALLRSILAPELLDPHAAQEAVPAQAAATRAADDGQWPSKLADWFQSDDLPPIADVRRELERFYLIEVLRRSRGNITAAAKMAGRHRTDFYELLRRHNLTGSPFRLG